MARRVYSEDERREHIKAASRRIQTGISIAECAKELNIPKSTLHGWLRANHTQNLEDTHGNTSSCRRNFIIGVAASLAATGLGASCRLLNSLWPSRIDHDRNLRPSHFLDLVLNSRDSCQLVSGERDPLTNDKLPLLAVFKYVRLQHGEPEPILIESPEALNPSVNTICFGAPVSNPLTRSVLDYGGHDEEIDYNFRAGLRYYYVQNRHKINRECKRYDLYGKEVCVPNWFIASSWTSDTFVPDIDSDGFLTSDYLLITRVRQADRFVTVIGGAHGIATQAFSGLMRDTQVHGEAIRGLSGFDDEFQMLFRLSGIGHDHTSRATKRPFSFEHIETVRLGESEGVKSV